MAEDLSWLCEELAGDDFATGLARTQRGWIMSTTSGLLASTDGCDWSAWSYPDQLITDLEVDETGSVWVTTLDGVWRDGEHVYQPGFSVRDHWREGSAFVAVGYDDEGSAWLSRGEELVPLPGATGALSIEFVDDDGAVYVQVPSGLEDRLFRVSSQGTVEDLFGPVEPIVGVTGREGHIYVAHRLAGVRHFDGENWSDPVGEPLSCLRTQDGELWGCPEDYLTTLARETTGSSDPSAWEWVAFGEFSDVQPLDCPEGTTYDQLCMPLWPTVEMELNWNEGEPEPEPEGETGEGANFEGASAQGCSLGATRPSRRPGLFALFALWGLGARRRWS
jgi:hypothetical protein